MPTASPRWSRFVHSSIRSSSEASPLVVRLVADVPLWLAAVIVELLGVVGVLGAPHLRSRSRARTWRFLTAASVRASVAAISAVDICSRWRRTRTSRSRTLSFARAAWTRSLSSDRIAWRLGLVPLLARSRWASNAADWSGSGPSHACSRRVASLRSQVMTMQLAEPLPRELPEPGIVGQGPRSKVVLQVLGRVQQGLLDDVGRIHPRGQPPVQPHGHHPHQPVLEPHQQLLAGCGVAPARAFDQDLGVGWFLSRGSSPVEKPSEMSGIGDRRCDVFSQIPARNASDLMQIDKEP